MKIGIIGVGSLGGTLARNLSAAGHQLRVANSKGVEGVRAFAEEIGAEPTDPKGAIVDAELVIVSVPLPAITELADVLGAVPADVPVADTGNYYPDIRDPHVAELDEGMTESVWVSQQLGRPVIKAFNNIYAHSLGTMGRPAGSPGRLALPVAGDNAAHKKLVMEVIDGIGFDPVDAGSLEESWRQQPSTPVYCTDLNAEETRHALASAVKGLAATKRARLAEQYAPLGPTPTHEQLVASNRKTNATS